jgi:hypothetical protein
MRGSNAGTWDWMIETIIAAHDGDIEVTGNS